MEFNTLVKTSLLPIFQKHGLEIIEESKNILKFQSSSIEINVIFNDYEKSCYIFLGKKGQLLHELRDNAIKMLFDMSISIEQTTQEVFVQNLSILFETRKGSEILKGNLEAFIKFKTLEDNNYTLELIQKQILDAASRAWNAKDYIGFIENVDKIGNNKVPQSYQLKYKIAKQKL